VTLSVADLHVDRGGTAILRGISFDLSSGERLTVTGSNGAGKTTLAKAVLGVLPRSAGAITIDGHLVGSAGWRALRRRVGYVSQHAVQTDFPISVTEVVAIGLATAGLAGRERRRRITWALELAGCHYLASAPYARLSGGEKQRVSIARCLCQDARLLILDEPTASLDPGGKEAIINLIEETSEAQGITVLLISHESAHFERPGWGRIALENGRLVGEGRVPGGAAGTEVGAGKEGPAGEETQA
jgi:zinc transport system ATP-binding protein